MTMMLATTEVEDFDQFERIFSTKGAEKRREHGSKGAQVFRDPNQENRVWVLYSWPTVETRQRSRPTSTRGCSPPRGSGPLGASTGSTSDEANVSLVPSRGNQPLSGDRDLLAAKENEA